MTRVRALQPHIVRNGMAFLLLPTLVLLMGISECSSTSDQDGDGWTEENGDCNDQDANVHPDAFELCDGQDNNCDGTVDEGIEQIWYADVDGDGFGNPQQQMLSYCPPTGFVSNSKDCDDTVSTINPNAIEVCDFQDNNCNGSLDEGFEASEKWYADKDGDGFGDAQDGICGSESPGFVENPNDCYDDNEVAYPGAITYGATDRGDGSWDYDCNGTIEYAVTGPIGFCDLYSCALTEGFLFVPACGQSPVSVVGCEWKSPTPGYPGAYCSVLAETMSWPQTCN